MTSNDIIALPLGSIVAYWEKHGCDPVTGTKGCLRKEYRVNRVSDWPINALVLAWGTKWRDFHPTAEYVLVERYIRYGNKGKWRPSDFADTYEKVLESVDGKSIALCPVLIELKKIQESAADDYKKMLEIKAAKDEEERIKSELKEASDKAWGRMWKSKRYGYLAKKWKYFVDACTVGDKIEIHSDTVCMNLYLAILSATTVVSKAKAIRIFLNEAKKRLGLYY